MYKSILLSCTLTFVFLLFIPNICSNNLLQQESFSVYAQVDTPLGYSNSAIISGTNQTLSENFKSILSKVVSEVFSKMFSQINQSYTDKQIGLQIEFPDNWEGSLIRGDNSVIVSPTAFNFSSYLYNASEKAVISLINSVGTSNNMSVQQIIQPVMNSTLNEGFAALEQLNPVLSVSVMSKDKIKMFQFFSGIMPPTKSLSSIWYEYVPSAARAMIGNVTGNNISFGTYKPESIKYSEINGIPTEIVKLEYLLPGVAKFHKILGYLFLTPDNMINIEYSADSENYEKYLSEFEATINTLRLRNPISINEENIQRFVS